MKMSRFVSLLGVAALSLALHDGFAQNPRQGRIIVPAGPGASSDIVGRMVAGKLGDAMGYPFIVENRPGAGTTIGNELVAKSAPDGATLLLSQPSTVISGLVFPNLRYDPTQFVSVTVLTRSPLLLAANPAFPPKSVQELVQYAKANPGKVNFGSLGVATSHHVTGEKLKLDAGIDIVHVPYKGGAGAAHADLMGGQIQIMFDNMPALMPHVKAGRLRPLATTGLQRSVMLPDVPTIAESGIPGFESTSWFGLLAPPGTPREVIARLNREVVKILALPDIRQRLVDSGAEIVGNSPEEADQFYKHELTRWAAVAKTVKLGID
jgi:tripartite-type tricarboxylate transporter receptor subunit TctC